MGFQLGQAARLSALIRKWQEAENETSLDKREHETAEKTKEKMWPYAVGSMYFSSKSGKEHPTLWSFLIQERTLTCRSHSVNLGNRLTVFPGTGKEDFDIMDGRHLGMYIQMSWG